MTKKDKAFVAFIIMAGVIGEIIHPTYEHQSLLALIFIVLLFSLACLLKSGLKMIHARLSCIEAKLRDALRCPVCGHVVISAPFNDGEKYECPECGEILRWKLTPDGYVLEQAQEELP
jgi:DNA-directed RNA polymerase subunit RPC12/RpoP